MLDKSINESPGSPQALREQARLREEERMNYINKLASSVSNTILDKRDELYSLLEIQDAVAKLDGTSLKLKIARFLSKNEKNYLNAKDLASFARVEDGYSSALSRLNDNNFPERYGTAEWFEPSLNAIPGGFVFHLPPLCGKKQSERHVFDGRYTYYLISNLMADYEAVQNERFEIMKKPVVIFLHHYKKDDPKFRVLDADNIDEKVATDALFGFLVPDDNLLTLWTMHFGIEDHSSFCDMFVIERDRLPDWMEEHKNMLIEG